MMGCAESALALLMPLTPEISPPAKLPPGPTLMAVALRAPGVLHTKQPLLTDHSRHSCSGLQQAQMLKTTADVTAKLSNGI